MPTLRTPRPYALAAMFCLLLLTPQQGVTQTLKQLLLMPDKLTAAHEEFEPECENCHIEFTKAQQTPLCLDCHDKIQADLDAKRGYHGLNTAIAGAECRVCHTDHKGREFDIVGLDTDTFNHELTNFPLEGQHVDAACRSCHAESTATAERLTYRLENFACADCHGDQDPHRGNLGDQCADCHSSQGWQQVQFDHDSTDFPLEFKHRDAACQSCHVNEVYENTPQECVACHKVHDVHFNRFGNDCAQCHSPRDWQQTQFDHDRDTGFKLTFKHGELSCNSCHTQPVSEQALDTACIGCHRRDDIHQGGNGEACQNCHTPKGWSETRFDHAKETDFPLRGEHQALACSACHSPQPAQDELGTQCIDCHALTDPHAKTLGEDCAQCHSEQGWREVRFSHDLTAFPLVGMHRLAACQACHLSARFEEADRDCQQCHGKDDVHKGSLGTECGLCHNPNDWGMWLFDHNQQTRFALRGAHTDLQCALCHTDTTPPATQCFSCHRDDDVHRGSFGRQCQQCHNEESFSRSTIGSNSP